MAEAVLMPRLGQSVESCILTEWVKKKGDTVNAGDVIFCYETDKAAFEETSKLSGILLDVFYNEGDEVPVLSNVAVIGNSGEDISSFSPKTSKTGSDKPSGQPVSETPVSADYNKNAQSFSQGGKIRISPRAKNLASLKGIDPTRLNGSGPNGRIIARDIEIALGTGRKEESSVSASDSSSVYTDIRLSNIRKLIASGMQTSLRNSAQLTHHTSADARTVLNLRSRFKSRFESGEIPNISLNDIICFAVVRALEKLPAINSHFLDESIRTFHEVNLGIAVDTERGLMVPALKNAGRLSLSEFSGQIKLLAENCRKGNINPDLLRSDAASFTVSNLGAYGVEMFTPVLNIPQCGILGVNTITYRPADIGGGTIAIIPVIGLSLTYDHRAIDGTPASAFLREVRTQIENFRTDLV